MPRKHHGVYAAKKEALTKKKANIKEFEEFSPAELITAAQRLLEKEDHRKRQYFQAKLLELEGDHRHLDAAKVVAAYGKWSVDIEQGHCELHEVFQVALAKVLPSPKNLPPWARKGWKPQPPASRAEIEAMKAALVKDTYQDPQEAKMVALELLLRARERLTPKGFTSEEEIAAYASFVQKETWIEQRVLKHNFDRVASMQRMSRRLMAAADKFEKEMLGGHEWAVWQCVLTSCGTNPTQLPRWANKPSTAKKELCKEEAGCPEELCEEEAVCPAELGSEEVVAALQNALQNTEDDEFADLPWEDAHVIVEYPLACLRHLAMVQEEELVETDVYLDYDLFLAHEQMVTIQRARLWDEIQEARPATPSRAARVFSRRADAVPVDTLVALANLEAMEEKMSANKQRTWLSLTDADRKRELDDFAKAAERKKIVLQLKNAGKLKLVPGNAAAYTDDTQEESTDNKKATHRKRELDDFAKAAERKKMVLQLKNTGKLKLVPGNAAAYTDDTQEESTDNKKATHTSIKSFLKLVQNDGPCPKRAKRDVEDDMVWAALCGGGQSDLESDDDEP